jgi:predicted DNA-binding WGR domain protein
MEESRKMGQFTLGIKINKIEPKDKSKVDVYLVADKDGHHKFYNLYIRKNKRAYDSQEEYDLICHYGKIGSTGQVITPIIGSFNKVLEAMNKRIKEKLNKEYSKSIYPNTKRKPF